MEDKFCTLEDYRYICNECHKIFCDHTKLDRFVCYMRFLFFKYYPSVHDYLVSDRMDYLRVRGRRKIKLEYIYNNYVRNNEGLYIYENILLGYDTPSDPDSESEPMSDSSESYE